MSLGGSVGNGVGNNDGGSKVPVKHINPYAQAPSYRSSFWRGVLPLPYKKKMKPPTGFTGHNAPYPTTEQINDWMSDGTRHNICLRLAGVDAEHEIVGIDVDHYIKAGKEKKGADQLQELETRLGVLPPTWTSSSRTDGFSGIRYFLVPRGFAFRGQVAKDIECISKGYRYAIVWPSIHEDTHDTYWWFPPGIAPDEEGRSAWGGSRDVTGELPNGQSLPLLPEPWFLYLTQNKMRSEDQDRIDMDSSVDEVYRWADETFHCNLDADGNDVTEMCPRVREKLDRHKNLVEDEATSHDKIVNAHYNLFRLAAEGHLGWTAAVNELEAYFCDITVKRGKRALSEVQGEIFRSRINGLRKVKAQCDERIKIGAASVEGRCDQLGGVCGAAAGPPPSDPVVRVGRRPTPPPDSYDLNDDGNAAFLTDMFSSSGTGADIDPNFRWAEGLGWIVWLDDEETGGRWEVDPDGTGLMRRMWHRVKDDQVVFAATLRADANMQMNAFIAGGGANGNLTPPANIKALMADAKKWEIWSEKSGNNRQAEAALEAAKSLRPATRISVNDLDSNPLLLGVANGILELSADDVRLRKAQKSDFITMSTDIRYEKPSSLSSQKWTNYLETFIPDSEMRRVVQILLGHCIVGGNHHKVFFALKGGTNTGKSTMINAIEAAMGDYAQTVDQSAMQSKSFNTVLGNALNKRFAVCSEFDDTEKLSAAMIKRITGGTDQIVLPIKYSREILRGVPQFVLILATNEVPQISGADRALQNRLKTIPFEVSLDPKDIDPTAGDVIKTVCGPAVLQWLVEGYVEYRRLGFLPTHQAIDKATEEFVAEFDEIATFAHEVLKPHSKREVSGVRWQDDEGKEWRVINSRMYDHFESWWRSNKMQDRDKPSQTRFSRRLKALGFKQKQLKIGKESQRYWVGVALRRIEDNIIRPNPASWQSDPGDSS